MNSGNPGGWPGLKRLPLPVKSLFTIMIVVMALAMIGALGQIVVHDIIPTFFSTIPPEETAVDFFEDLEAGTDAPPGGRDLFDDLEKSPPLPSKAPVYESQQFVWLLRWTHIHLFGMSMIFLFMGAVTVLLDLPSRLRALLVVSPFGGILVDIASMWLKTYVSPHFFWLHIPGGGLFVAVFLFVSVKAVREMWCGAAPGGGNP